MLDLPTTLAGRLREYAITHRQQGHERITDDLLAAAAALDGTPGNGPLREWLVPDPFNDEWARAIGQFAFCGVAGAVWRIVKSVPYHDVEAGDLRAITLEPVDPHDVPVGASVRELAMPVRSLDGGS